MNHDQKRNWVKTVFIVLTLPAYKFPQTNEYSFCQEGGGGGIFDKNKCP